MIGGKLGPYEIREEIGKGGMATVYRAYQSTVDRDVAIKVITKAIAHDDNAIQRFQREARLIARLEHPHILPVYDFDGGHERPYIVMRYLDSGTLNEVLAQGQLSLAEITYLMQQVGAALDYAHRQGIVHRDIKPSNIMIDREGNAFVTDFGLARMVGSEKSGQQITATGAILGTPDYMSPEQAMGESDIDQRVDIYAMGVILFQMLTGDLPFVAETTMSLLMMHMQAPIPKVTERNPTLPPAIDNVITIALAKQPADRHPTAAALAEAITTALGNAISSPSQLPQAAQDSVMLRRLKPDSKDDTDSKTPSEQNKTVTVLAAGATEYAEIVEEERGPEAARSAVKHLWDAATDNVANHGGTIIARSDDTLLALWGVETARESDAEQAIRAALEIQAALQVQAGDLLAEDDDEPLPLNIGLNTGLALISPGDTSGSYTASGTTISLTNRLMQSSYGAILITHDTYSQVRGIFHVEQDRPLRLRRGRGTISTYRVLAAKPHAFRLSTRGVEGLETQLVGREAELKTLQNAFLDAVEEEETQVVTLVGEAGLGKSRLLYEFSNWAELRPEHFWVLRGRATPEMSHRPYALLRDILSIRFDIRDSDSPATVRQKLETGLTEQVSPNEEMAHLLGYLAGFDLSDSPHLKGMLGDPQQLANWAKQTFKRWLAALCEVDPVVIELEDLHHADEPTLDLLNELVNEHDELPLLLIGVTRPALFERRPTWGSGLTFHTRLELHPLDRRDSRGLVREILQKVEKVPKTLRDLLVERAQGNPYYLEELVKSLIDDRVIIKESDDNWRVESERLGHAQIPATLVGLLQARLDSLLYPEKLTLQRAAVIGRIFYDSALAALDFADETHLDDLPYILARLVEREFIYPRETTAFEGNQEYIFGDQMLREVLLTTLLRRQQEIYHGAAAEWLVQISGERVAEYSGLIADYYEKAGEAAQAAHYLERTGERARAINAYDEARTFFERALNLLYKSPGSEGSRTSIQLKLGATLIHLGEYAAATDIFESALVTLRRQDDRLSIADILFWLGRIEFDRGNNLETQRYVEESLSLAQMERDEILQARNLALLGYLYIRLEEYEAARAAVEKSLALASRNGNIEREMEANILLGNIARGQCNSDEAIQFYMEALAQAQQLGNRLGIARVLNNLGSLALERGYFPEALSYYEQAISLTRETGDPLFLSFQIHNLCRSLVWLDDLPSVRRHLFEALTLAWRIKSTEAVLYSVRLAGWLNAKQGNLQQGLILFGLVLHHSATTAEISKYARVELSDLGLDPKDPTIAAQLEAGKDLDLDEVVKELLVELSEE